MPEDASIEDGNLLMHPRAQVHGNAEAPEGLYQLRHLVGRTAAKLLGWASEDAHSNATGERRTQRVYPTTCTPSRRERRKDNDRLPHASEVLDECWVKGAFGERASCSLWKVEG